MKIEGDGFLSESGQKDAQQIVARYAEAFRSLEYAISELRLFASSQEVHEQDTEEEHQKAIALVLVVRVLEISEAALLVMKNGMSNEANTLFSVFLDAYFILANVYSDASFVANYFKSDEATRLKLLNSAKKHDSELFRRINEYGSEALMATLKNRIVKEKIKESKSYANAKNIGCSEIYDSLYRLSSASLHTTPRSLKKYMDTDEVGTILSIKNCPLEGDIPQRVYDLSRFLINLLSGLKEVFGYLDETEIRAMISDPDESMKYKS